MPYSETVSCYFSSDDRNRLLINFFGDSNYLRGLLDQPCENFCYIAKTGNGKIVKIGITEKPQKRLFYSIVHFNLKSLKYVAVFPGSFKLESFLLDSFIEQKINYVKGKRAIEWFENTKKVKDFLAYIDDNKRYSTTKEFYSYF